MKRIFLILFILLLCLVSALLIGGPYYAKNYLEENDKQLIGRDIRMSDLDFNALNGHLLITDFEMLELDGSQHFFQFDTLFLDLEIHELWSGHLKSEACHLIGLSLNTWMHGDLYNFSDLLANEDSSSHESRPSGEESFIERFTFNDIQIRESGLAYEDRELDVSHGIQHINIELPGISIADKQTSAGLEFSLNDGGIFKTHLAYDIIENSYQWTVEVEDLNINPFTPYAQKYMLINNVLGSCNGDILIAGDLDDPYSPMVKGQLELTDFSIQDEKDMNVLGCESLYMDTKELDLATENYHFNILKIDEPFCHISIREDGNNMTDLFLPSEAAADSSDTAGVSSDESTLSYSLDEFRVSNGRLTIEDHTMRSGLFDYAISNMNLAADGVTEGSLVTFTMDALMNGKGDFNGNIVTDPGNLGDGEYNFYLKNTAVKDFSPFIEDATAFPLTQGLMSFHTENSLVDKYITSRMVIDMYDPVLAKKRKDLEPEYNVPLKLGLAILKDPKGRVNLDILAEGHVDDPDFKFGGLVWNAILNVLVKAATSPYSLLAKSLNIEEDELKFIRMEMLQNEIGPEQTHQLDLIGQVLEQKPELNAKASLTINTKKEQKLLREYIAKRDFYLKEKNPNDSTSVVMTDVDKVKISELKIDDDVTMFLALKTGLHPDSVGVNALLESYVPLDDVNEKYTLIQEQRIKEIRNYFSQYPATASRFIVEDNWTEDESKNRPRFEMIYDVGE